MSQVREPRSESEHTMRVVSNGRHVSANTLELCWNHAADLLSIIIGQSSSSSTIRRLVMSRTWRQLFERALSAVDASVASSKWQRHCPTRSLPRCVHHRRTAMYPLSDPNS